MKKAHIICLVVILILGIVVSAKMSSLSIPKIASNISKSFGQKETISREVVSFVSPHHLVAKDLIENIFQKVAAENKNVPVESIILVSPNHKNAGNGWVNVSGETRTVENGTVEPNERLVKFLTDEKLAYREDAIFHGEHGIENLLPYAKKYFPEAKITPLIVRDGYPED